MSDKKQNVLIVHNYYQIPGGEDTVVANEKKLLEENGHQVWLYTRHNAELKELKLSQKLLLPFATIFNVKTYITIKKLIKQHDIQVVHVHNTLTLMSPAVYYAARACGVRVVQTIHNFRMLCPAATFFRDGKICEDCLEHGLGCAVKRGCYRGSKLQTLLCVMNIKLHRITGIYKKINYICLTEFNKEKLLQHGQIKAEQIYVKPNFTFTQERPIVPYAQRKNEFICVGRLEKLKGTDVLLHAWKLLGENAPPLMLCGTGELEDWAQAFVREHQLNVALMGFVPNDVVKGRIANAKALIMCSQWYEGFPMTIAEAYSLGTPVIGANVGNVGDLVRNGQTGETFEYTSAAALANVIAQFSSVQTVDWAGNARDVFNHSYSAAANYKLLQQAYGAQ